MVTGSETHAYPVLRLIPANTTLMAIRSIAMRVTRPNILTDSIATEVMQEQQTLRHHVGMKSPIYFRRTLTFREMLTSPSDQSLYRLSTGTQAWTPAPRAGAKCPPGYHGPPPLRLARAPRQAHCRYGPTPTWLPLQQ